jgi:hypothetical protein
LPIANKFTRTYFISKGSTVGIVNFVRSAAQENLFLIRWPATALKQRSFSLDMALTLSGG